MIDLSHEEENALEPENSIVVTPEDKYFYTEDGVLRESIYRLNTAHMTTMLACAQFMTYLLHFQLRFLEGDIYLNSEFCGGSDALAIIFGAIIYNFLGGLKATYFFAFCISSVGILGILYVENNFEQHPEVLQPGDLEFYRRTNWLIFMSKFGISMSSLACTLTIVTNKSIFQTNTRKE